MTRAYKPDPLRTAPLNCVNSNRDLETPASSKKLSLALWPSQQHHRAAPPPMWTVASVQDVPAVWLTKFCLVDFVLFLMRVSCHRLLLCSQFIYVLLFVFFLHSLRLVVDCVCRVCVCLSKSTNRCIGLRLRLWIAVCLLINS